MAQDDQQIQQWKAEIRDATAKCYNCNFCLSACPVIQSNERFVGCGGSGLTQALYYAGRWDLWDKPEAQELMHNLYRCTMCKSCVNTCQSLSAGIPLMEIIEKGRKIMVEKALGPMPAQRKALESMLAYGNPYGQPQESRLEWLEGLELKWLPGEPAEVLLYLGCSTCYEPLLQKSGLALIKLLKQVGVDFGILAQERTSGDVAIRLGEDVLFEELAERNREAFAAAGAKHIVCLSPHDYDTFVSDYEGLGDEYHIWHYSQYLSQELAPALARLKGGFAGKVTYHDPCYLSKHHGITQPPRELLGNLEGLELVEMRLSGKDNLCCGGGGGRMFTEVEETQRLADLRVGQALETGAQVVATACPWCHLMLDNAVKDLKVEDRLRVREISELLAEAYGL